MSEVKQSPTYDVVEWAVSMRWLMLAFFLLGLVGASLVWLKKPAPTVSYTTTIQIYPGGSWARNAGDVAAMLWMDIQSPDLSLRSNISENPLVVSSVTKASADEIEQAAEHFSDKLIAEASDLFDSAFIASPLPTSLVVRQDKLEAELFFGGVDRGVVDLIKPFTTVSRSEKNIIPYMVLPPIISVIAFLLLGTAITTIKRLRT